jgi:hypothetical protein
VERGLDGFVYVSSFLDDRVWRVDPQGEVVDLVESTPAVDGYAVGPGGGTPAGPIDLRSWAGPTGAELLVLGTLSNGLSRIALEEGL